jgi:hypothetical protein
MRLNFTTLFNINYAAKGLALYDSLLKTCPSFHLYIFAFDDVTYKVLTERNISNATIIALDDFENAMLLRVKKERSVAEYCWTCTSSAIKYCIEKFSLDHCTYLDADTYFYSDPGVLIAGMGDNQVLITPHNYHTKYDQSAWAGIYCVQFITFKNNANGMKVLNWWVDACINWCYARYEDGKMGDQKYLDSWPYIFEGIYICTDAGAGLAPWNLLNYDIEKKDNRIIVNNRPLVFFHFHDLKYLSDKTWYLGGYDIPAKILEGVYKPYLRALMEIDAELKARYNEIDSLNVIDIKNINAMSLKFKVGIYILDLKKSFRQFVSDLFFIGRRKHYKDNYIHID